MNSLKTLVVAALLVAGLYVAYQVLNHPVNSSDEDEVADPWGDTGVNVDTGTLAQTENMSSAPKWSGDASNTEAPPYVSPAKPEPIPGSSTANALAPAFPALPTGLPTEAQAGSPGSNGSAASNPYGSTMPDVNPLGDGPTAVPPDEATRLAREAGFGVTPPQGQPAPSNPLVGPAPQGEPAPVNPLGGPAATTSPYASTMPDVPLGNREDFATFMGKVNQALNARRLAEAHQMLSLRYRDAATPPAEARRMEPLLDQLAGTVIYSRESFLEAPYEVSTTDTLESIAARYNVPTGLLAKINGINPSVPLKVGEKLKVVRGPFTSNVDATRGELTLMLHDRYAGRFRIVVGPDLRQEGAFMVTDKKPSQWRGGQWIAIGSHMGMHAAPTPPAPGQPATEGCIGLSQRDIGDLYDILSIGSTVTIRR